MQQNQNQYKCIFMLYSVALSLSAHNNPGAHFTNKFSIVIQIRWKIVFNVTPLQDIILLKDVAHNMTAQLLYHVLNFIAITSWQLRWEHNETSIEFELRWKNRSWNRPWLTVVPQTGWDQPPDCHKPRHATQAYLMAEYTVINSLWPSEVNMGRRTGSLLI